jgi:hypothetical protein
LGGGDGFPTHRDSFLSLSRVVVPRRCSASTKKCAETDILGRDGWMLGWWIRQSAAAAVSPEWHRSRPADLPSLLPSFLAYCWTLQRENAQREPTADALVRTQQTPEERERRDRRLIDACAPLLPHISRFPSRSLPLKRKGCPCRVLRPCRFFMGREVEDRMIATKTMYSTHIYI